MRIDSALSAKVAEASMAPAELQKLHKSARQFEAMLLSSLWKEEQSTMADEEGDDTLGGMKGPLQDLAFQAIATKAANAGGFGIARMIENSLKAKAARHGRSGTGESAPPARIGPVHASALGTSAKIAAKN
jgi:Rod binding domain-containing protein